MGRWLCIAAAAFAASAGAELQNVTVGGEIRIRPRYWHNVYSNDINGPQQIRIPAGFLPARAIGPWGANSRYRFDDSGSDLDFVEQRNRLYIDADFTDEVGAYEKSKTIAERAIAIRTGSPAALCSPPPESEAAFSGSLTTSETVVRR